MDKDANKDLVQSQKFWSRPSRPATTPIVPFGPYGAGAYTGHPIGLFLAIGLLLMGLVGIPEARLFFAASLPLGALFGYLLWRRHR